MRRVKILSWNVNGIRAVLKKNFLPWLQKESPDILCLQETKVQPAQLPPELLYPAGYQAFWNSALRPGYSGVATFSRGKPVSVTPGFGIPMFDGEGRLLETDHGDFTLLNVYFPNGKMGPERLKYKLDFYDQTLKHLVALEKKGKKLVLCGDVNTAHQPMDLARPKENEDISGFLPIERKWIDRLMERGFIDTFRELNKDPGHYSWWDLKSGARERNVGWRIDYHFISPNLKPHLEDAFIMPEVTGSDHCPVGIILKFN